jgi:dethiobiotin synthetase
MRSLFVTATNTGVGKTRASLKLIETLAGKGIRPGVYKPIETGVKSEPEDASALLQACAKVNDAFASLTTDDITAYTFELPAAPFCADEKKIIDPRHLVEKHDWLLKKCDILIVEGAGGLLVPVTETYMMIHLIKDIEAQALLVTPSKLGCINDTLLSMMALRQFDVPFEWCVNLYEDREMFKKVTQPYYDAVFPNWWSLQEGLQDYVNRLMT